MCKQYTQRAKYPLAKASGIKINFGITYILNETAVWVPVIGN